MDNKVPSIAHVGVAVKDIKAALHFYRDVLGVMQGDSESADGAEIVPLHFGDVDIELLSPATEDSPIARFLDKRGPGIHHICIRVPDIDEALKRCLDYGYRLVDELPRKGAGGRRIAFIHPQSTAGILLELTD